MITKAGLILSLLPDEKSVLEIGCGCGETYGELFKVLGSSLRYTGIDDDLKLISEAKKKYPRANIYKPVGSNLFNGRTYSMVIIHERFICDDIIESARKVSQEDIILCFDKGMMAIFPKDYRGNIWSL